MTSAAQTPSWIPTTIDELLARLNRGEWPRVRILHDEVTADQDQCEQGRVAEIFDEAGTRRLDLLLDRDWSRRVVYVSKSEPPQLWVWAMPVGAVSVQSMLRMLAELGVPTQHVVGGVDLNINATAEFSLTELGASAWNKRPWPAPVVAGSPMKAAIWEIMQALGPSTSMGFNQLIQSNTLSIGVPDECVRLRVRSPADSKPGVEFKLPESVDWGAEYLADLRLTLKLPGATEPSWSEMIREVRRLVSENKRRVQPHRSYTMTAETLGRARNVARLIVMRGLAAEPLAGTALLDALRHAEGMPADDLRKLVTWASEYWSTQEKQPSDLIEIIDSIRMHLAIDELPAGSVAVIGEPEAAMDRKITVTSHPHVSIKDLLETSESESLDRLGDWLRENMGEHFAIEGIADTAIRRLREADALLLVAKVERERLAAEADRLRGEVTRLDRTPEPMHSTRESLGELLELGRAPSSPAIVESVKTLVEFRSLVHDAFGMLSGSGADVLAKLASERGMSDQRLTASLIRIDRAARGMDETETYHGFPNADGIAIRVQSLVQQLAKAKASLADNDRTFALIAEELGNPSGPMMVALVELFRKNRRLDVVLGELFGISKHGQSLSADELIAGAKAKLEERRSLTTAAPSFVDKLAAGIEFGRFVLHASPQHDLDGETVMVVHERRDGSSERVFAITSTGQDRWSKWTIENGARTLIADLSLALLKVDAISRCQDPDAVEQKTTNGFVVGPDGLVSTAQAIALVDRLARQSEGFRQLAERTMIASAELAACESLVRRGFDRLVEVDPEYVESLRKSGS